MSFETLREKRFFFPPLIALVRPHGWITKDSSRNAVQRGGNVSWSGINAEMGDASLHLSFLLSLSLLLSLCQLLWVSITLQSKWMLGKDYYSQTVKRRWLMSPVFNHHTVEWFYAYFICISLNRASAGHSELERYKVGGRERESEKEAEEGRSL